MDVILTLIVIFLLAFTIYKKIFPTMVLLAMGILVLTVYTIVTQKSIVPADISSGNIYIDIFEFVRTAFVSNFISMGMVLMPVVGYAAYMNHLGASKLLAIKAIKPFKNVKNPYIFCAAVSIIGALFKLALPAQTGLLALFSVTIYPVMIAAGMSKAAAGASCLLGTSFDWGPACPATAMILVNSTQQAQASFFINFVLPIYPIGIIVAAVLSAIINQRYDKKEGFIKDSNATGAGSEEEMSLPGYYAIFPVIPLVIMVICSEAVLGSVVISPFAATIISFFVVIIIETIRNKSLLKSFEGSKKQFTGMGTSFADMITLIASAAVFAGGVQRIGGFATISNFIIRSGLPGIVLIVVVCIMSILMTMVVASAVSSITTFAPFAMSIAKAGNFQNETILVPFVAATGISRAFSPISSATVFISKFIGIEPTEIIKRNTIPFIGGLVVILIASVAIIH
jgi:DcuC family C4-dicarboxylate transporter